MITAKVDYKVKRGHKYQITNLAWQTYPFPNLLDFDSLHTQGSFPKKNVDFIIQLPTFMYMSIRYDWKIHNMAKITPGYHKLVHPLSTRKMSTTPTKPIVDWTLHFV